MDDRTKIAVAVAGGYLLGRTKKGKAALSLALWLAGKELGLQPRELVREGVLKLASTPQISQLGDQLRGPVAEAGRKAALATLESQLTRFSDGLQSRTSSLTDKAKVTDNASKVKGKADEATQGAEDELDDDYDDEYDDEADDRADDEDDLEDDEAGDDEPTDEADDSDDSEESGDGEEPAGERQERPRRRPRERRGDDSEERPRRKRSASDAPRRAASRTRSAGSRRQGTGSGRQSRSRG